jgi:hypothetical protein
MSEKRSDQRAADGEKHGASRPFGPAFGKPAKSPANDQNVASGAVHDPRCVKRHDETPRLHAMWECVPGCPVLASAVTRFRSGQGDAPIGLTSGVALSGVPESAPRSPEWPERFVVCENDRTAHIPSALCHNPRFASGVLGEECCLKCGEPTAIHETISEAEVRCPSPSVYLPPLVLEPRSPADCGLHGELPAAFKALQLVTCDRDSTPHLFGDACTGVIHPHETPDDLAENYKRWFSSSEWRGGRGITIRESAMTQDAFASGWDACLNHIIEMLRQDSLAKEAKKS